MLSGELLRVGSEKKQEAKLFLAHGDVETGDAVWLAIRLPQLIDQGMMIDHVYRIDGSYLIFLVEKPAQLLELGIDHNPRQKEPPLTFPLHAMGRASKEP